MKLDRDIMVDLETLATTPDAVILTIAGIRFNYSRDYKHIEDPYDMDFFYCRIDTDCQTHRYIDPDTLAWWAKQDPEVKHEAFSPNDRLSLNDAMTAFNYWASGADRYWANGAAFDFPILETANADLGNSSPWRYWQAMDARTIYKLVPNHYSPTQSKHHALFDCLNQIQKLNDCLLKLKIDKL
jgi:3' exoribonuclease, RNase T-like